MKKIKLSSISGNSEWVQGGGRDPVACKILHLMGFRELEGGNSSYISHQLSIAAYPQPDQEFFVYYDGLLGDTQEGGNFRLVKMVGETELELDKGVMSLGHYNGGTRPTYYGKGMMLSSYSFHFQFTTDEARQHADKLKACSPAPVAA